MAKAEKFLQLNDGYQIPILGLGTGKHTNNFGKITTEAAKTAIECGYRHIDGAAAYENEADIGLAIEEMLNSGNVKRDELFITSKVWNTHHRADKVKEALLSSLRDLKLDYVDLYLIHWPTALNPDVTFPIKSDSSSIYENIDFLETWKVMEEMVHQGLIRSIGVSNFNSKQLQRLLDNCKIKPTMNQVECHPYFSNSKLIQFCRERNVLVTAYSPLGSPSTGRFNYSETDPRPMDDPTITGLSQKYGKSAAQIIIRWLIQKNVCVIPKSVTPSRIKENFDVFDFRLSEEDCAAIEGLNRNHRILDVFQNDPYNYPFHEEF